MEPPDIGIRFIVMGRVQGVFFRASAAREAARLGLRGHALNLPDGRVEVLAVGARDRLEELGRWLRRGPPAAHVERVLTEELPETEIGDVSGFRTG